LLVTLEDMLYMALLLAMRLAPEAPDAPLKQPQMAVQGSTIAMTYGIGNRVYFVRSTDAGKTFSKPVKVAEAPFVALGMHRGPRIVLAGKDTVAITAITGGVRGKEGDLTAWRSTDGGKTWSSGTRVNDIPHAAREGLHGMAARPDGTVWTVWLDLRDKRTVLYGSVSRDRGATWGPNRPVYDSPDGHICECCHPTALLGANGEMLAMWRNWLGGSRDMYVAESKDGGTWKARKLGSGTWPLNACPMDGGGLAIDTKGVLHSAWRRDGAVYATGDDGKEIELGKGKNPAIAAAKDGVYIAWQEGPNVVVRKPGGKVTLGPGTFPMLASSGDVVFAAWEQDGAIHVEPVR
jgi:hypothetical protein